MRIGALWKHKAVLFLLVESTRERLAIAVLVPSCADEEPKQIPVNAFSGVDLAEDGTEVLL